MDNIPTLDDLRVKSCFICLEEEHAPAPSKATTWVHPCPNCPLLAHDKCLLRWISSLPLKQKRRRRLRNEAPTNRHTIFVLDTFRCPRCRRGYELANPKPPRLHGLAMLLDTVYVLVAELADIGCTAFGLATIQVIPLALSVESRLAILSGMLIYELAFLDSFLGTEMTSLLIPSRFSDLGRSLFIVGPTIPFRLLLPGTIPRWIIPLYLSLPLLLHGISEFGVLPTLDSLSEGPSTSRPMISTWPPSPALLGLAIVPIIRPVYNRLFSRFRTWVLGSLPPHREKRYLSDRVRSIFFFGARPPLRPPTANVLLQDQDPAPIVIADAIVQKDQSSFTHDVLHAVMSVAFPRMFGEALHVVSEHSLYLRRFLGLRPSSIPASGVFSYYNWVAMALPQRALAVGGLLLGGSWIWADVDPVWWRYSLGSGIFVLAKDCFELYRLWLQKHEVQSRTIKSRDFTGVDVTELDLIAPERFA
ncbi:hypothetical protein DFH07DRAFT_790432 [Mycena maculata]|uniref:RING-CH-type domain-containing protein n=1 Tax=Mycena maculata TaxID=230809 RepID=A0AAD7KFU1_9AGAR|nr:hypothetical protein DFH07DRAFT_790432 [Mycena maculata]